MPRIVPRIGSPAPAGPGAALGYSRRAAAMNQRLTLLHRPAAHRAAGAVGGQCRRRPAGRAAGAAAHAQLPALGARLRAAAAAGVARAAGGQPMWGSMRRYAVLGLLGVGCYNALQYLAVKTSTPVNVTLVASSMPVFMLALGAAVLPPPRHAAAGSGRRAVDRGRAGGAGARRARAPRAGALRGGRPSTCWWPRRRGRCTAGCSRGRATRPRCAATGPPS